MSMSGRAGLSMYHISPRKGSGGGVVEPEPKITFRRGASLLSCELGKTRGAKGRPHEWKRGEIKSFSKGARRRMLRLVASLKRAIKPVFCTLTYPDVFPDDPKTWKKHLDIFFKRLLRRFPKAIIIWRLERIERKSGINQGQIAPHFHLLAYNVPYLALLAWLPRAWFEVVNSGDPKHLNAGTRVESVRSVNGILYYTSKYICKAENDILEGIGRTWGIVGRGELPTIQGEVEIVELDPQTAMTVLRMMRRKASRMYKKGRYIGKRKIPGWGIKFTLIGDADFWYHALPKIACLG